MWELGQTYQMHYNWIVLIHLVEDIAPDPFLNGSGAHWVFSSCYGRLTQELRQTKMAERVVS